ncbi:MAG: hypothetical protein N3E40_00235, partial [Dehalococcoidia bacterium]|nr:hypothetical protein [Dehalococcoidia bacterium]
LAVETWYCGGNPVLSVLDLELKKKYNELSDVQTGCSADLIWLIEVDGALRSRFNGPLDEVARYYIRTGLLDVSVIYDSKEDKAWVLECCGSRFAYNCFYTMLTLLDWPVSDFLSSLMCESLTPTSARRMFDQRNVYGASVRVFNDDKAKDVPVIWCQHPLTDFYPWDCRLDNEGCMVTCGDESVGILAGKGDTPESALARVKEVYHKLHMPTKWVRADFDEDASPRHLLSRFRELKRLGWVPN